MNKKAPKHSHTTSTCRRCGTCCVNGGPALHEADRPLIQDHRLTLTDLITIRAGEPVFSPLIDGIEPSRTELLKISGNHDSWTCRFFSKMENTCGIYAHRPMECCLLKCWEPSALTATIYQHCLSRRDVLAEDDALWELITLQEAHCGYATIAQLNTEFAEINDQKCLTEIARIINLDLKIRTRSIQMRNLSVAEELLFFGRPLFKSLDFYSLAIQEGPFGLTVIASTSFGAER